MRRKEQYALPGTRLIFLSGRLTMPRAKHGHVRHVMLNSRALAALIALKTENVKGRVHTLVSPRSWFELAVAKAGLTEFTWHALRHTFISSLVMNGVDLWTVRELAGHKSIAMDDAVTHLAPSHLDTACEKTGAPTAATSATEQKSSQKKQQVVLQ